MVTIRLFYIYIYIKQMYWDTKTWPCGTPTFDEVSCKMFSYSMFFFLLFLDLFLIITHSVSLSVFLSQNIFIYLCLRQKCRRYCSELRRSRNAYRQIWEESSIPFVCVSIFAAVFVVSESRLTLETNVPSGNKAFFLLISLRYIKKLTVGQQKHQRAPLPGNNSILLKNTKTL